MSTVFRLGLIINPLAGLGGRAALKGSDGVAEQALAMGVEPLAQQRVRVALEVLWPLRDQLRILAAPELMGSTLLGDMGFKVTVPRAISAIARGPAN